MIGIPAVTRAMVDLDIKTNEDFDAAAARANYSLMQTLSQKDISAVMMLPDAAEKMGEIGDRLRSRVIFPGNGSASKIQQLPNPRWRECHRDTPQIRRSCKRMQYSGDLPYGGRKICSASHASLREVDELRGRLRDHGAPTDSRRDLPSNEISGGAVEYAQRGGVRGGEFRRKSRRERRRHKRLEKATEVGSQAARVRTGNEELLLLWQIGPLGERLPVKDDDVRYLWEAWSLGNRLPIEVVKGRKRD